MNRPVSAWRDPAWWGVAGPVAFITSWIVAGLLREGYDPRHDAISRLAEQEAPGRWIVLTGIAIVSFASIVVGVLIGRRWKARIASVFTVLGGVSALALGIYVCSPGCPGIGGEFTDTMHSVSAVVHYISFGASPLVVAFDARRVTPSGYRAFSVVAGLVGGSFLLSQFTGWGPNGLTQRAGLTTLDVWMMVTAVMLYRTTSRRTPPGHRETFVPRG